MFLPLVRLIQKHEILDIVFQNKICCIVECDIIVCQAVPVGHDEPQPSQITTNEDLTSLNVTFQPSMGAIDEYVDLRSSI